jgi:predicted house-cleaning noncanonical NTP pyrophosphatase (MazG superfamily)
MRALFLAALLAAPAAAADIQAELLEPERRLLGAVLADSAKAAEYQADCLAADDAAQKPALVLKWRAAAAAQAESYMKGALPTNPEAKTLKEMLDPSEWGYLMATIRLMEPGFIKDQVISMIEKADADLATGDPERAESFIKMARDKAREDVAEYQKTEEYLAGLAEASRRRIEAAKKAKEQAEQAEKDGRTFDGGGPKQDEVVVVPPSNGGESKKEEIKLQPSKDRPNLVVNPGQKPVEPPAPSLAVNDDMAELRRMKKGQGGFLGILGLIAPVLTAIVGGVIGAFTGGIAGAAIGAAAGYGLGVLGRKLLKA